MTLLQSFRLSADYNLCWVNTRLYDACAGLSAADYRADLGAFFRSVHGTTETDLDQSVCYVSLMTGRQMSLPRWTALTHLFNHQIHHRGQLTALLSRLGVDYGDIDLVWMPGVASMGEAGT